jgi:hypothetical protein
VTQDGKPNKLLLSLTSKGRSEFMEWVRKPISIQEFTTSSDPFSQKFLFFSYLNESDVKVHCAEQVKLINILIDSIRKFMQQYHKSLDRYALWDLEGTVILLEGRIRWLDNIISELK